jgi:hypothetical protein
MLQFPSLKNMAILKRNLILRFPTSQSFIRSCNFFTVTNHLIYAFAFFKNRAIFLTFMCRYSYQISSYNLINPRTSLRLLLVISSCTGQKVYGD